MDVWDLYVSAMNGTTISQEHIITILYNALVGLKRLHEMGLMHRDIKPMNMLVDEHCQVKIADYGLARGQSNRSVSPHVMTRAYRAPEVAICEKYGEKVDVFSLGCILYELMTISYYKAAGLENFDLLKCSPFRSHDSCTFLSPLGTEDQEEETLMISGKDYFRIILQRYQLDKDDFDFV